MFHKKYEAFSVHIFKTLWQYQFDASHAVSKLDFSSKICRVSCCGCHIAIFTAKNGEEIFVLRKLCLPIYFEFLESFHTRF
jgi:hypothetical protein